MGKKGFLGSALSGIGNAIGAGDRQIANVGKDVMGAGTLPSWLQGGLDAAHQAAWGDTQTPHFGGNPAPWGVSSPGSGSPSSLGNLSVMGPTAQGAAGPGFNVGAYNAAGNAQVGTAGATDPSVAAQPTIQDYIQRLIGQIPLPNHDAYIAPYQQARAGAQDLYGKAVPFIGQTYDQLGQNLATSGQQLNTTLGQTAAAQQATQAQEAAQLQAMQAQGSAGAAAMGADPSVQAGARVQDAGINSSQAQMQNAEKNWQSNLAQQASTDQALKQQETQQGKSGALLGAQGNLNAVLNKIGIGQAGAEQAFTQADQAARAQQAQMALGATSTLYGLQHQQALDQGSLLGKAEMTPQEFMRTSADQLAQDPTTAGSFKAYQDVIAGLGVSGQGIGAQAAAMKAAQAAIADPNFIRTHPGVDPNMLLKFVGNAYDNGSLMINPYLRGQIQGGISQTGGDPALLAALMSKFGIANGGGSNPNALGGKTDLGN